MRTAVVGHVEWVQFARVARVPRPGEIVHAEGTWEGPGGSAAGAAVQLAKLGNETSLFTALGEDELGRRAAREIEALGVGVNLALRNAPSRRAFIQADATGERAITVMGERLAPRGTDALPWGELERSDGTYFTAGDLEALRRARASRVLVATSRVLDVIEGSGIRLDALVGSASDPDEAYRAGSLEPAPKLVVMTSGSSGGRYWSAGHERSFAAPQLDGPLVDSYGAGDSFAGGLTYALAAGASESEAVAFAARCGAAVLRGTGPFEGQLEGVPLGLEDDGRRAT